jgi:hypothetical protein
MAKWRMRIVWWIPRTTNIHSGCVIAYLLLFHCNNGYTNAPQRLVIRTLPLLLISYWKTKILDRKAATTHRRTVGIKCIVGLVNQTGREFCLALRQPLDLLNKHLRHKMRSCTGGINR